MVFARRPRAAVVVSQLVLGVALTSGGASAGAPDRPALPRGATDISSTAKGHRLIKEAKHDYAARGIKIGEMRAVKHATGILIAPLDTQFTTYRTTLENGTSVAALAPLTADDPVLDDDVSSQAAELAGASWSVTGNNCFRQITDTWSVLDHCYYKYKLSNDGNSSFDWYALRRYGTARNNSPWVLDQVKIRAYRSGGASQTWADWSPRSNWSGGSCSTASLGISSPVGGLSASFERCPERVTFTKSANGSQPDYTQMWFGLGTRDNREVEFEIAVRVAQGGAASFAMPAEVHGSAY